MKRKEVEALFPLTVMVTQEIIDKSQLNCDLNCIGANTLRSALPKEEVDNHLIRWGVYSGRIFFNRSKPLSITTKWVDMMEITKPTEVTFYLI